MNIEINDRLYNDFVAWAKANNMSDDDMRKYIEKAFRDRFTLDKYGDLNDKIVEVKTEEKKPKRTTKRKSEGVNDDVNEGYKIKPEGNPYPTKPAVFDSNCINEQINEHISEHISEQINEPEKPKRKTKVIQSK